ncbi:MAG: PBP1A family penicillin-binding protein [Nitrospirae bacterium]|nr:PBP1A family penicillin-binding protein [Nitrospirota bacterium]
MSRTRLPRSLKKKLHFPRVPSIKWKVVAVAVVCFLSIAAGSGYAIFDSLTADLPKITSLKNYKPPVGTRIFSADDHLIGRIKVDKGIFVPLAQIPDSLKKAAVAVEDARFYTHKGIDPQGILRAVFKDVLSMSLKEGGSTITQQLTKVYFLTPEKSLKRKLKEVVLARKMEQQLTKDEILELYLNKIYFGHGAYGVEMAARTYFGKRVGDLTLGESAVIAGLIRSPLNYSPYNNMERARNRQKTVLGRMVDEKYITQGQADKAYAQPMVLKNLRVHEEVAPHLVEQIRMYLEKKYGVDKVYNEGLEVRTTINYRMQEAAQKAVEEGLRELDKRQGYRGPVSRRDPEEMKKFQDDPPAGRDLFKRGEIMFATVLKVDKAWALVSSRGGTGYISLKDMEWAKLLPGQTWKDASANNKKVASDILKPGDVVQVRFRDIDKKTKSLSFSLEQEPLSQAALVAIDPWEGKVVAQVGGYDFQNNEFNHAVNARRQPGSAFKPFVYATALESGFTPASIMDDSPKSYDENAWKPQNFDGEYYGPTRLREALVESRNVVTVDLLNQVGVKHVVTLAQNLGLTGPFTKDLTLALGSCGVTPMELTAAYTAFANGGYSVKPVTVTRITDSHGKLLEANEAAVEQVLTPETAYQITSILKDVVARGTARRASWLKWPVAGKTGTTNDYKDAWFVGYTPYLVAGVWVGNDDTKTLGRGEAGARSALPIWINFMGTALGSYPQDDFKVPEGITFVDIDADSGLLAAGHSRKVVSECFKAGTEPTDYTPMPAPGTADIAEIDADKEKEKARRLEQAD